MELILILELIPTRRHLYKVSGHYLTTLWDCDNTVITFFTSISSETKWSIDCLIFVFMLVENSQEYGIWWVRGANCAVVVCAINCQSRKIISDSTLYLCLCKITYILAFYWSNAEKATVAHISPLIPTVLCTVHTPFRCLFSC